jgi:hypothetical protein
MTRITPKCFKGFNSLSQANIIFHVRVMNLAAVHISVIKPDKIDISGKADIYLQHGSGRNI